MQRRQSAVQARQMIVQTEEPAVIGRDHLVDPVGEQKPPIQR